MLRKILELPRGWLLACDDEARPAFVHKDGRRFEPKEMAFEPEAQEFYRIVKLEEDRRVREVAGVERTGGWVALFRARTVLAYFFNLKVNPDEKDLDKFVHDETERELRKEQTERARAWQ